MCSKRRNRWICTVLLLLPVVFLFGCSSSTEEKFENGRLYAVNNTRWETVRVVWDEVTYDIPRNMNSDRTPTGIGAVELGDSPLAGGTTGELICFQGSREKKLTILIDGSITVDLYMRDWEDGSSDSAVRILPGKQDGVHPY